MGVDAVKQRLFGTLHQILLSDGRFNCEFNLYESSIIQFHLNNNRGHQPERL